MTGKPNEVLTRRAVLHRIKQQHVSLAGFGHVTPDVLLESNIRCQINDHVYYFLFGVLYCGIETSQGLIKQKAYYDPERDDWFKIKCDKPYAT